MPFLHHRISSTTNTTVLISTKSPINSFAVLNLNGTVDWVIAQRNALLAWTGHSLSLSARVGRGFGFARWGNTKVTGRGLIAMTGSGTIFQVRLQVGEKFVVNPSNVVAYTLTQQLPEPYRFPSVRYDLKQPWMSRLADLMVKFGPTRDLLKTGLWHRATQLFNTILKWSRQAVFGNELFMKFSGPATILISSRTAQLSDRRSLKDARPVGTETHVAKPSGPHL
ncbi:mitochondrial protein Fmp26 [Blumeria hordei DH14]|nr:mitochondrial protein Fmp26 [Blumeria hordei DH14]